MILQVHDELVFECPDSEVVPTTRAVRRIMESVLSLSVPLTVDAMQGENWEEMQAVKE